jgi:hypothetical protein
VSTATEAPAPEATYEAGVIASATATYTRAMAVFAADPEWDREETVRDCFWDLAIRLRRYHDLCRGIVPAWFPGIKAGPEGYAAALRHAADYAAETAQELVILLPAAEGEKS